MGARIMIRATIFDIVPCCGLALLIAGSVAAAEVYRCDGSGGPVFQDAPCAPSQKQTRMRLAPAPPPPDAADDADDTPASDTTPQQAPARSAPAAPRQPPPSFFLCSANDGSQYVNSTGQGRVSWVPYSMVDNHNTSLAEAYGGPNGLASHPSGAANIPHRPAGGGAGTGAYVEVVDPCHHAGPREACAYLRGQLDELAGKIRRAFSDTEAQLKQERARVAEQLRGCS